MHSTRYTERNKLFIALSYCSFLKNSERLFLAQRLDTLQDLTVLSMEDIFCILNRKIMLRTSFALKTIHGLVEKAYKLMQRYRISPVNIEESSYPPQLREITDSPFMIYYRGILPNPMQPALAMVGTRTPTGKGIQTALRFAAECGHLHIPVISGLARGIDTFAHKGALETGGQTTAVLACGVDTFYPISNSRLAGHILEQGGCILSEYPPGEKPMPYRFPQRNRIISGLSRAIMILEAPKKSGALITARFALEQGRDVCTVAELLKSPRNEGGRNLTDEGAIVINSVNDLLREWGNPVLQYKSTPAEMQGNPV